MLALSLSACASVQLGVLRGPRLASAGVCRVGAAGREEDETDGRGLRRDGPTTRKASISCHRNTKNEIKKVELENKYLRFFRKRLNVSLTRRRQLATFSFCSVGGLRIYRNFWTIGAHEYKPHPLYFKRFNFRISAAPAYKPQMSPLENEMCTQKYFVKFYFQCLPSLIVSKRSNG